MEGVGVYWFLRRPEGELVDQEGRDGPGEGPHPEDPVIGPVAIDHSWPKRPSSCSITQTDLGQHDFKLDCWNDDCAVAQVALHT